jgi:hypothetical protein
MITRLAKWPSIELLVWWRYTMEPLHLGIWTFRTVTQPTQKFNKTNLIKSSHFQPWRHRLNVPPKRWCLPSSPHCITTEKTKIDQFTAARSSNLKYENVKNINTATERKIHWINIDENYTTGNTTLNWIITFYNYQPFATVNLTITCRLKNLW